MRLAVAVIVGMLLALPAGRSAAGGNDSNGNGPPPDPIAAAPDQSVVYVSNPEVAVSVSAPNVKLTRRARASLIIYTPNGTMLKTRLRDLRKAQTKFRLSFRSWPVAALQRGTYTVYATVETGSSAFGVPTSFAIADD